MVKVIIRTKGQSLRDKVMNVTRKCLELSQDFHHFWWEFTTHEGRVYFSASYKEGEESNGFEFPLCMVEVDERYKEIQRELDELKWSAIYWQKEEHE